MRIRTWLLSAALLTVGCEGVIGPIGDTGVDGEEAIIPVPIVYVPPDVSCDIAQFADVRLEEAAGLFASDVYPAMVSGQSQCVSCHAPAANRRFTVTSDATETFYQSRGAGFFADDQGSVLARLINVDDRVRMPQAAPAFSDATVQAVAKVACMLKAFEANGGTAADEQFPPELLLPYGGAAISSYDNPFLNFVQLKGKVKSIFNDDWVRTGADQYERNIGLFGGVNFTTHFVEARVATPDFLLGMDSLAPDVCGAAATAGTGPFAGLTLTTPIIDVPAQATTIVQIESLTPSPATGGGNASTNPAGYFCYTNCTFAMPYNLVAPGTYRVTVRGKPTLDAELGAPQVRVQIGVAAGQSSLTFSNPAAYEDKSVDVVVTATGMSSVSVNFFNDGSSPSGGDRNLYFDSITVMGPLGAGTGTTRADGAKQKINSLYQRMVYRPANATELTATYELLKDLSGLGTQGSAWSGVCEALMRHPDFLFTMPPEVEKLTAAAKDPLRLVALTQRALGRPPTAAEFTALGANGFPAMIDQVFASPDFRKYYFNRIQLRIESQGTAESDEPARLWTYVTLNGRNFEEVLTAEYTVDEQFVQQPRPAEHGKTGLLTARGYLNNKPGLPHYNFPARVLSGFMGAVFEVPPEVFDQRGTATATSTVDPQSVCFSCHQLLTPLAHQRLKWTDDGTYLGASAIDDSDRGLVANYPYKGIGLEAFTTKAVKKEPFVRRMINTQVRLLIGRELRAQTDERVLYKQLWDTTFANGGDMRAVLKTMAASQNFQGAP